MDVMYVFTKNASCSSKDASVLLKLSDFTFILTPLREYYIPVEKEKNIYFFPLLTHFS
jgi:hypothetical protein